MVNLKLSINVLNSALMLAHQRPRKCSSLLPLAELSYNTTFHLHIGMTHFQALYGRLLPSIPHYQEGITTVKGVGQLVARGTLPTQGKFTCSQQLYVASG